jgi:hypothetical protein
MSARPDVGLGQGVLRILEGVKRVSDQTRDGMLGLVATKESND